MVDASPTPSTAPRRPARALLLGLAIGLALAPLAHAAEPLVRIKDGALVLPSSEPLHLFKLAYPDAAAWPTDIEADLAWRAEAESLFVDSVDAARREILARTTARGRDLLRSVGMTVQGPEAPADHRDCVDLLVAFDVDAKRPPREPVVARAGAFCPWSEIIDPDRHLVVEGLDRRGQRLYAVRADDPSWAIHETVDDHGDLKLLKRGREPRVDSYVRFQAPDTGQGLWRLRIWRFRRDGRGAPIAEVILRK